MVQSKQQLYSVMHNTVTGNEQKIKLESVVDSKELKKAVEAQFPGFNEDRLYGLRLRLINSQILLCKCEKQNRAQRHESNTPKVIVILLSQPSSIFRLQCLPRYHFFTRIDLLKRASTICNVLPKNNSRNFV